jgi:ubiquinol-cytochrome c reductase cytochrome b subunit
MGARAFHPFARGKTHSGAISLRGFGQQWFLPWLDRSPVRSIRYKGRFSRVALALFVISFLALGYLGLQPAQGKYTIAARLFTVFYFAYFWFMPVYSKVEAVKGVPARVR